MECSVTTKFTGMFYVTTVKFFGGSLGGSKVCHSNNLVQMIILN